MRWVLEFLGNPPLSLEETKTKDISKAIQVHLGKFVTKARDLVLNLENCR